eukprot:m.100453 g.100453  ORF g.100453 m.100453 type:complete len:86 (+) comp13708_c0_seq6:153-410(+)
MVDENSDGIIHVTETMQFVDKECDLVRKELQKHKIHDHFHDKLFTAIKRYAGEYFNRFLDEDPHSETTEMPADKYYSTSTVSLHS